MPGSFGVEVFPRNTPFCWWNPK